MIHTKAFYEERRANRAAQRKEYKDNRSEEKEAYRKIFNEAQKEDATRLPHPVPSPPVGEGSRERVRSIRSG